MYTFSQPSTLVVAKRAASARSQRAAKPPRRQEAWWTQAASSRWSTAPWPHAQHEDREVRHSQNDSNVVIPIANRSTHDADGPNACRGRVTRGGIALSDDCARTDETDAGDHALHDVCVHDSVGTEHGYGGLHQAATRYGNKGEGAQTFASFLARSMPSDR
jgi:hypothetical protein